MPSIYDLKSMLFSLDAGGRGPMDLQPAEERAAPCTRGTSGAPDGVICELVILCDLIFGWWEKLWTDFGFLGLKRKREDFSLLLN